jgi:[ribosomal protein S5]-alanine N-acetyltransferase
MFEFETERLRLRNWKQSDVKDVFEYTSSDLVGPRAGWPPHQSEEDSKNVINMFIEDDDVLAVELKSENKVIGSLGFHKRYPDESLKTEKQREIGYVLNPKYWGNGFIPEAVKELIRIGFEDQDLEYIWCAHYDDNLKSKRVIEKNNFNFKFKKNETLQFLDNKKVVTWYYNIKKDEYK